MAPFINDRLAVRARISVVIRLHVLALPLIAPGVITGALFAFVTSLDEVVVVIFLAGPDQLTIPRHMWSGIRQEITLSILAMSTILIVISVLLLTSVEWLRRRNERLRGIRGELRL